MNNMYTQVRSLNSTFLIVANSSMNNNDNNVTTNLAPLVSST